MIPVPFVYNASILEVIDGDTIRCRVDRGDYDYSDWVIRLVGLNAREHADAGGPEATAHLAQLLPVGKAIALYTLKPDKYAPRKDAIVHYLDALGTERVLNDDLVATHWAAAWNGAGTKPVPPWPRPETG